MNESFPPSPRPAQYENIPARTTAAKGKTARARHIQHSKAALFRLVKALLVIHPKRQSAESTVVLNLRARCTLILGLRLINCTVFPGFSRLLRVVLSMPFRERLAVVSTSPISAIPRSTFDTSEVQKKTNQSL
jgi:hypothetical protein